MQPLLLHLDGALKDQPLLCAAAASGHEIDARDLGPAMRLWSRPATLERLRELLRERAPDGAAQLVFAGSGDFHHVTPMLIERAIEGSGASNVTIVHFDNHPDWVRFGPGMHCGSWVARAARLSGVARLITVGVCSSDIDRPGRKGADLGLIEDDRIELYAYRNPSGAPKVSLCGRDWPTIETLGEDAFASLLDTRIQGGAVYITIDKDVLRSEDAVTNWDQGRTSLDYLKHLISAVASGRCVIGADVVGDWSRPVYGEGVLDACLKRAEALMDQPWRTPPAAALNQQTNLALLSLFEAVS